MSIARHHNEWLSLIEVSGPFLSLPVLMRVFPQGLDALDRDGLAELRLAYEEWLDDQNSLRPSPAIHSVWVRYVLEHILGIEKANLLEGPAVPPTLKAFVAEQGETLHPDLVIASNDSSAQKPNMLIQVYPITQGLEKSMHDRRWKASPAMRMLELLRATGVSLGLVTNGEQWMLVNAPRGETSAFISWYAALWLEEPLTLRAFTSLLGAPRFFSVADEDTLEGMLKESVNEQQEVTDQLGYQVRSAVEVLIRSMDKADQDMGRKLLKQISEADLYEAALTIMMRLVFLFSAEERGLLLLGEPLYDQNYAVSTLRAQLHETAEQQGEEVLERRFDAWCRLLATFRAVYGGIHHDRLNLPAYGGSLFDPDRFPFLEGRSETAPGGESIDPLPISNRTVLHLLDALQVLRVKVPGGGPAEPRRLSFRSLDVEQIGHVYEGLLDHIAVRAKEPVLGLRGSKDKEPEIPLSVLHSEQTKGEDHFLEFLGEQTGRSSVNAIKKALHGELDVFDTQRLQIACDNDPLIFRQILPFAGLLREDDFGFPTVFLTGSVYVTAGATRRATGTHYTPRSLTEPIVQHTLEPLVYTGPAEGLPKEEWKLKSPAELLDLKVCDMAMGSAGFLVQVVRYLSERLVEAWDTLSSVPASSSNSAQPSNGNQKSTISNLQSTIRITPEGKPATGKPGELIIPQDDEERLTLARRLVADRCIYGVDKNPLAVEIAKLSIWLTTMDKGRPFTFLDHALKCGDSLVGADEEMYRKWAYNLKGAQFTLYLTSLEELAATARQKRKELESFTILDVRDTEHKAQLLKEADEAMARVKLGCDLLVGVRLLGLKASEQDEMLAHLLWDYIAGLPMETTDAQRALAAAHKEHAFHWSFEFPEVFEKGGFSAFVGNPPFLGGRYISGQMGLGYLRYIKQERANNEKGNADFLVYFFLQASQLLHPNGQTGFIATKTVAEGDSRDVGLAQLLSRKGVIITRCESSKPWPGIAAVLIVVIHWAKNHWKGKIYLDDLEVNQINSRLESETITVAYKLQHLITPYQGSYVHGMGFLLSNERKKKIIEESSISQEVIYPCLSAEDYNTSPTLDASRFVIYFGLMDQNEASQYIGAWEHVKEYVKPERETNSDKQLSTKWWLFKRPTKPLYEEIWKKEVVLVCPVVTKYLSFAWIPSNVILLNRIYAFIGSTDMDFSILQSTIYEIWARKWTGNLGDTMQFAPTDCFDNFPYPIAEFGSEIGLLSKKYHEQRRLTMLSRTEGLTTTYNRFHNPKEKAADTACLRELQVEMDNAVSAAYGWSNLDLGHGFHETAQGIRYTISEAARREVLARLLKLNHERYEEEVKMGLHEKKGKVKEKPGKKGKSVRENPGQYGLF